MWPLTPVPPSTRAGYAVTFADKMCCLEETKATVKRIRRLVPGHLLFGSRRQKGENFKIGYMKAMLGNQVLVSAVVGWTVAQVLKTLIDFALNKSFNAERLVGSGGMPSSHSATVCGLTTAAALKYGAGSFEFAISFILAMVVMYDAVGVRQETGKQARLLNSILLENPLKLSSEVLQQKLKEYVGHTPIQVVAGAILGIVLALVINNCY